MIHVTNIQAICDILDKNNLNSNFLNVDLYRHYNKQEVDEKVIIDKINSYHNYVNTNKLPYSEEIMRIIRDSKLNNKYDYSRDNELISVLGKDDVFKILLNYLGLKDTHYTVIKDWIENIYNVNLN